MLTLVLQVLLINDSEGKTVREAGAVLEHNGHLYPGGDVVSYVSKLKL